MKKFLFSVAVVALALIAAAPLISSKHVIVRFSYVRGTFGSGVYECQVVGQGYTGYPVGGTLDCYQRNSRDSGSYYQIPPTRVFRRTPTPEPYPMPVTPTYGAYP